MGNKRPREDLDAAPQQHKKHKSSASDGKPRFQKSTSHNGKPQSNPLNPLRSRIRSLQRLLAHDDAVDDALNSGNRFSTTNHGDTQQREFLHTTDELEIAAKHEKRDQKRIKRLPAQVRMEHERELVSLREKVEEIESKKRRGKMVARWHMVRFFERRRAERVLKRARKRLKALDGEGAEGKKRKEAVEGIREAEIALNYALYYPLEKAYVSLWPTKKGQGDGGDAGAKGKGGDAGDDAAEKPKGDPTMWKLVEKCMADGRLDALREGEVEGCGVEHARTASTAPGKGANAATNGHVKQGSSKSRGGREMTMSASKAKAAAHEEEVDEDSDDGGFFEK